MGSAVHITSQEVQSGAAILSTLAGGGVAGALIKQWFTRRTQDAQIEKITAEAHSQIYKAYGDLLDDLRADAASARAEANAARKAAWAAEARATEAETRATAAETRAAAAEARAAAAEAVVGEIRTLVRAHPNAEELLRQIEELQRRRRLKNGDMGGA